MSPDPLWLFASLLVSSAGAGLFIYGKKQNRWPHLVAGLAMGIYPYFVPSVAAMLVIAAILAVGLWMIVRAGH